MKLVITLSYLFLLIAITYLSLTPTTTVSVGNDKLGHFIAYATLMFHSAFVFKNSSWKQLLIVSIFPIVFGVIMEFGQSFVPGRDTSFGDLVANTIGVFIGFIVFEFVGRILKQKLNLVD